MSERISRHSWLYHDGLKATTLVLCCIFILISLFSLVSVTLLAEFGFYTGTFEATQEEVYTHFGAEFAESALRRAYQRVLPENLPSPEQMELYDRRITAALLEEFGERNVLLTVTDAGGNVIATTYGGQAVQYEGETSIFLLDLYSTHRTEQEGQLIERFVHFVIPQEKAGSGLFYIMDLWLSQVYDQRFPLIGIGFVACLLSALFFVLLLCAAGRHPGEAAARLNVFDRLPTDLMILLYAIYGGFLTALILSITELWEPILIVPGTLLILVSAPLSLLFCMSFATRCKCGTLIKSTLCYRVLTLIYRSLSWFWRHALCPLGRAIRRLIAGVPLVPKTVIVLSLLSFFALCALLMIEDNRILLILWLVCNTALFGLTVWITLGLRRLQEGGQALSRGELQYKIEIEGLAGDFRRHAEDLNSVSEGMSRAVEERMKSERFRTELITNVAHDIKTPLTTIISYVNLLRHEPWRSETAEQYLATLDRQSSRLKKLMEDLIEVSKATTGNLSVNMVPCRLEVMLTQALGEYEARMKEADLIPVLHTLSPTPVILADGRLLWRVLDNLLSNALKYAMPGTRVYLDLGCEGNVATILFRNVSKEELNVPADDLLERFVRGDRSRHTEGSGLGLSIALSLTELMGGELTLEVDGDLFKVALNFPIYEEQSTPSAEPTEADA